MEAGVDLEVGLHAQKNVVEENKSELETAQTLSQLMEA